MTAKTPGWPMGLVFAAYVVGMSYFAPPALLFGTEPIATYDYSIHAYQADRALRAFESSGALWSYDPQIAAGHPANAVGDLTSKTLELFVLAGRALGTSTWRAFNLYVLLVHLSVPWAGYASARILGWSRRIATLAALLWSLLWVFDSFVHWCWYIGMISWAAACCLAPLVLSILYRALSDPRPRWFFALAGAAMTLTLLHPFAVVAVAVPAALMYGARAARLRLADHAFLWGAALLAGSTVLVWIRPAWRFRHYIEDFETFLRPAPTAVLFDGFDLLTDVLMTGSPVRTMVRLLCFAAAIVFIVRARRESDLRGLLFAGALGVGIVIAYGGNLLWLTRQTQPYRQIGPATMAAALAAARVLPSLTQPSGPGRSWVVAPAALLIAALALIVPRFARNVLVYVPDALPPAHDRGGVPLVPRTPSPGNEVELRFMGHARMRPDQRATAEWLAAHSTRAGRVLVMDDWVLGEHLATFTDLLVLGGFPDRFTPHLDAHPLRQGRLPQRPGRDELDEYLERYAVELVVAEFLAPMFRARPDLVEPVAAFGRLTVFRRLAAPSLVLSGHGTVSATLNTIRVREAAGAPLVLKMHWMETLHCEPDCAVERQPIYGDRIGFIRVPDPPRDLVIRNVYP